MMVKKAVSFFVIFIMMCSNQAFAHTSLTESNPADGEVVIEPIQELNLIFGTKVEESSSITVIDSYSQPVSIESISINYDKMTATFLQPLENGVYEVKWNIIGADGHPMEGNVSFTVDVPMTETSVEEPVEVEIEEANQSSVEVVETDVAVQSNKLPSYVIPVIMGVLLTIVVGSIVWMMRRKK